MALQNGILNLKITHYAVIATEFRHFTWSHRWNYIIYSTSSMPLLSVWHFLCQIIWHLVNIPLPDAPPLSSAWLTSVVLISAWGPRERLLPGKLLIQTIFLMTILLFYWLFCPPVRQNHWCIPCQVTLWSSMHAYDCLLHPFGISLS